MSFGINTTIPAAGNDPADDQQPMQQNFANISGFLNVDHVTPGSIGDGFHTKVTFFTENIPLALPLDPISINFTANAQTPATLVSARATLPASPIAQEFYANASGVFPLSTIRAFCKFTATGAPGAQVVKNGFNVTGVLLDGTAKIYTISLTSGATTGVGIGQDFVPIVSMGTTVLGANAYTITTSANTVTITFINILGAFAGFDISLAVLQV